MLEKPSPRPPREINWGTVIQITVLPVAVSAGFFLPLIFLFFDAYNQHSDKKSGAADRQEKKAAFWAARGVGDDDVKPWEAYAAIKDGKRLYGVYCLSCHQAEGHGLAGMAPFIRNPDFLAMASDQFLRNTIIAGRPGTSMMSWAHLKREEKDNLIAYLRSAESTGHSVSIEVDSQRKHEGSAEAGKGLYATFCAACHGQNATGYAEGGSGPAIGNGGFLAVASDDFIFQTVKHGRRGTAMRSFMGAHGLANLAESEVGSIIAYLRSDREPVAIAPAAAGPDPKEGQMHFAANCAACHQLDGSGLPGIAPSIRNADFLAIADDHFIKETVRRGRVGTAMIQRPDLTEPVLDHIIAYLRSVPSSCAPKVTVDPSKQLAQLGDSNAGHDKFAVFCAACHGEAGKGYVVGGSGPAIGLPGFLDLASDDYIFQTLKHGRSGTAMRPFLGATGLANLAESDIHDIIAYLRKL
ncbi:MAG: mono/diheme cytochrome c family protein [Verrucomicrobiales bacterium]|jgi:mono/diheme cytochrome c family protein